ncbi:amino acid/amide ABC transporter substrate-binding protein, HAAT family [Rhodoblastus acidophilus]|uniref:Amino acid/amide ABC transporter substrate-binding protein, HAAT family n=1 Tax=Rhodoblastus acidophilus TaxID=1074 RepID=A0A212R1S9_RHOAC|nr:ABC transporter substrate-binding protein [Rhodoblastus acidophilus]PPQ40749.1 ABC transporter permease [Rhodoblastus acidophilus]RAI22294.1 ABC transporter permease [Rhodoblastus acidophilus]SNB65969.1 amino acid/amide ABC transporter substrate-binding protein, HAAT family [Rhodoblastus acidophilus]
MKQAISLGVALTCLASAAFAGAAFAADKVVKVGVLTDGSGPYADVGGVGSQLAAQLAIDESGLAAKGWKVELIYADHLNKVDVGASLAREWFDQGKADVIVDTLNSGVALAVSQIVKDKNKVFLNSGAATSDLTGKACTPNQIHWTYDTYALANGTGKALTKAGGDSWYFITADYAFGKALERDTSAVVKANGGQVLGDVMAPLNNADFSSQLLQAQSSKAKVIGLANAGADSANAIKQAAEFGVTHSGQKLAALLIFLSDIHSIGLTVAQGLEFTATYYWDLNDGARAFAEKFSKKSRNAAKPTMVQAGVYSATLHYLKAVDALGSPADGAAVVAKMKALPTDDDAFGKGSIREDGRKIHPAYLLQVKTPAESKYPWDYAKVVATIPAEEAFRPLSQSECPLVKK